MVRPALRLNGFDPLVFDGRDPAAFVWAILEAERRLEAAAAQVHAGRRPYPVRLPYGVAVAPKGFGFPGAGTNLAHNLPLMANPRTDARAAGRFNAGARRLWVPPDELRVATERLQQHAVAGRGRERDNPLAHRDVSLREMPPPPFRAVLEPLHAPARSAALGYVSAGGTYDTPGLLFVNRSSWAHIVAEAASLLGLGRDQVLDPAERDALDGRRNPQGVVVPAPSTGGHDA